MNGTEVKTEADIQSLPMRRYEDIAGVVSVKRISWGGILAGSVMAIILQLWLSMLGISMKGANPITNAGVGSAIWLAASVFFSFYVGGWLTARLAGIPRFLESALHGAVSWATATLFTFLLIGGVIGSFSHWSGGMVSFNDPAAALGLAAGFPGTSWGVVILMLCGLCAGVVGALFGTPEYPYKLSWKEKNM